MPGQTKDVCGLIRKEKDLANVSMLMMDDISNRLSGSYGKDAAKNLAEDILRKLEATPITFKQRTEILAHFQQFLKRHDLKDDSSIAKLLSRRFSFSFLPSVSVIGGDQRNVAKKDIDSSSTLSPITSGMEGTVKSTEFASSPVDSGGIEAPDALRFPGFATVIPISQSMRCSVKRIRSTLRTSNTFQLYFDGYV